ncbi:MAG TPA: alpha/beta hydrolase [bacterium]|nr:alpha/beta hydrolase [bacterium]HNB57112.1 alpha/beta hydrolase [bacterium]HNC48782.1 alpha/beta hydrolase [bacterium]HNJ70881.1 alpha/beta hydrolase [bacterium]HNL26779.1 alpha/beta hydrolase [bacterium]
MKLFFSFDVLTLLFRFQTHNLFFEANMAKRVSWFFLLAIVTMVLCSCRTLYHTETIVFYNNQIRFSGTFYKPLTSAPYPVIVIAHGSGTADRNSFFYKPYGEYFSKHGIAVFIFDKRGVGDSEGVYDDSPDFQLLASDLKAAFQSLSSRNDIDKNKIGIVGISQAAWVLPITAQNLDGLSFVVCTSCPSVPPYESDLFQKGRELIEAGYSQNDIDDILNYNRAVTEYVATFVGREKVLQMKHRFKDRQWFRDFNYNPDLSPEDTLKQPQYDHYRNSTFDPMPFWNQVKTPVLFVYGSKDSHIPVVQSIKRLEDSIEADQVNYRIKTYRNAGHLIQSVEDSVESLKFSLFRFIKGRPQPIPEYLEFVRRWVLAPSQVDADTVL